MLLLELRQPGHSTLGVCVAVVGGTDPMPQHGWACRQSHPDTGRQIPQHCKLRKGARGRELLYGYNGTSWTEEEVLVKITHGKNTTNVLHA